MRIILFIILASFFSMCNANDMYRIYISNNGGGNCFLFEIKEKSISVYLGNLMYSEDSFSFTKDTVLKEVCLNQDRFGVIEDYFDSVKLTAPKTFIEEGLGDYLFVFEKNSLTYSYITSSLKVANGTYDENFYKIFKYISDIVSIDPNLEYYLFSDPPAGASMSK